MYTCILKMSTYTQITYVLQKENEYSDLWCMLDINTYYKIDLFSFCYTALLNIIIETNKIMIQRSSNQN